MLRQCSAAALIAGAGHTLHAWAINGLELLYAWWGMRWRGKTAGVWRKHLIVLGGERTRGKDAKEAETERISLWVSWLEWRRNVGRPRADTTDAQGRKKAGERRGVPTVTAKRRRGGGTWKKCKENGGNAKVVWCWSGWRLSEACRWQFGKDQQIHSQDICENRKQILHDKDSNLTILQWYCMCLIKAWKKHYGFFCLAIWKSENSLCILNSVYLTI